MISTNWQSLHASHFNGHTALVTGGAGFIGSHLVGALLQLGCSVRVIDDLSGGYTSNLEHFTSKKFSFTEGSILDTALLNNLTSGCTWVFHQAALGSVPRSITIPELYQDVNSRGTFNVLEAARQAGVQRVVFAASSSAYGDSPTLPKVETMPVLPRSPYAATKVAGEAMLRAYATCYPLDTCSLRYFNIFGPRQNSNSAYAAVIAAFAKAYLDGTPPVIFGDGEQSRDFTYVDNAVHANLLAARSANRLNGEVINVACGTSISVSELAAHMGVILGAAHLKPEHRDERGGDVKHSLAAIDIARERLGYTPIVSFDDGLQNTCEWYRQALQA